MNTFPRSQIVFKSGPLVGLVFPLDRPSITIGREIGVEIHITSPLVSRRHARISLSASQDNHYFLEDLGSSNGTYINGVRVVKPTPLTPGDQVHLGSEIVFEFQGEQTPRVGATIIGEETPQAVEIQPPQLLVGIAGQNQVSYTLKILNLASARGR